MAPSSAEMSADRKDHQSLCFRSKLHSMTMILFSLVVFPCLWLCWGTPQMLSVSRFWAESPLSIEQRVDQILKRAPLFDGHNDLAYYIRWAHSNHIYLENFTAPFEAGTLKGEVDIARLRRGRVGGTFWSVFADCPKGEYSTDYHFKAIATTDSAVDVVHRLFEKYPSVFGPPQNSSDAIKIFKSGRIVSPLGLEGLHLIGDSFTKLRDYHARGVRYATLTHNCNNAFADSALRELPEGGVAPAKPRWGGVSPAGQKLVEEMNRLGILVDLSHTSAATMRDVLGRRSSDENPWAGSLAPPIFSHSCAFALCPHPRNVPDDVLHLLAASRGIIMVTFSPDFVSCRWPDGKPVEGQLPERYEPDLTIPQVVRHIKYIGDLIGYEYIGLGSDFDGVPSTLRGLEDVSKFPDLVAEMLRQGVKDKAAEGIVGNNLLRVWKEVDDVAVRLQAEGRRPAEDNLPWLEDPWK
ncbi:hypothetical protein FGRMN_7789 [Fusarium graminum]|nr:hypothetical protein FGRMN_7789 [Fusarium graminum]